MVGWRWCQIWGFWRKMLHLFEDGFICLKPKLAHDATKKSIEIGDFVDSVIHSRKSNLLVAFKLCLFFRCFWIKNCGQFGTLSSEWIVRSDGRWNHDSQVWLQNFRLNSSYWRLHPQKTNMDPKHGWNLFFKVSIFRCHVSFPGCRYGAGLPTWDTISLNPLLLSIPFLGSSDWWVW